MCAAFFPDCDTFSPFLCPVYILTDPSACHLSQPRDFCCISVESTQVSAAARASSRRWPSSSWPAAVAPLSFSSLVIAHNHTSNSRYKIFPSCRITIGSAARPQSELQKTTPPAPPVQITRRRRVNSAAAPRLINVLTCFIDDSGLRLVCARWPCSPCSRSRCPGPAWTPSAGR